MNFQTVICLRLNATESDRVVQHKAREGNFRSKTEKAPRGSKNAVARGISYEVASRSSTTQRTVGTLNSKRKESNRG